jgi:ArsR family transcriptional regulator, virulence genes transcriptional regulator
MVVKRDRLSVEAASEFLKNFANPTRLRLLCALSHGECCVGALAEAAGVPLAPASQQLANLRRDKIVIARRCGQTVYYRLANDNVGRFIEALASSFCPSRTQGVSHDPDPAAEEGLQADARGSQCGDRDDFRS